VEGKIVEEIGGRGKLARRLVFWKVKDGMGDW
jgi:hypothetical protein